MGYDSHGDAELKLRSGCTISEARFAVESSMGEAIDEITSPDGTYYVFYFSGWHMYAAGDILKKLAQYFDGEISVNGEEDNDIWKIVLRDGQIYTRASETFFDRELPTEIKDDGSFITNDMKPGDSTNEKMKVARNMMYHGGGFVSRLGAALEQADPDNARKIRMAFSDYWKKYLSIKG